MAKNVQGGGVWSGELIVAEPGSRMEICPSVSDVITLVTLVSGENSFCRVMGWELDWRILK